MKCVSSTIDSNLVSFNSNSNTMRIVICWSDISGYMAACFRELASRPDIDLKVIAWASGRRGSQAAFEDRLTAGFSCRLLEPEERDNFTTIRNEVIAYRPDAVLLCGWFVDAYRRLPRDRELTKVRFSMGMDTPWWGTPRQYLAKWKVGSFVRKMHCVIVTGERSWQYAIRLGVGRSRIRRGMYGVDYDLLAETFSTRSADGWPKSFLFAGRYAPEKGLDILLEAYRNYRRRCAESQSNPWSLICCGQGPLASMLSGKEPEGVTDLGFQQPKEMLRRFTESGVLVLPSLFDPWPLILVESCAAGLPVIASDACGSAVEMLRPHHNGWIVASGEPRSLGNALWEASQSNQLPSFGKRSQCFADAYSASKWADRMGDWL